MHTEKTKETILADMDAAATIAISELQLLDKVAVKLVADWWGVNYTKTGHKRLGRALVAFNLAGKPAKATKKAKNGVNAQIPTQHEADLGVGNVVQIGDK